MRVQEDPWNCLKQILYTFYGEDIKVTTFLRSLCTIVYTSNINALFSTSFHNITEKIPPRNNL